MWMGVSVDFFFHLHKNGVFSADVDTRFNNWKVLWKIVSHYKYIYGIDIYFVFKFTLYYETLSWN